MTPRLISAAGALLLAVTASSAPRGDVPIPIGSFDLPRYAPLTSAPQAMDVVEVTGDGRSDLVVGLLDRLEVWRGDDVDGFVLIDVHTGLFPVADLAVGDLDGDTHLDIVTVHRQGDRMAVFLGDGSGVFTAGTSIDSPGGPRALALADLDGDDVLDLLAAHQTGGWWTWRAGDGTGGFGTETRLGSHALPWD